MGFLERNQETRGAQVWGFPRRSQRPCGVLQKVSFPMSFLTMVSVFRSFLGFAGPRLSPRGWAMEGRPVPGGLPAAWVVSCVGASFGVSAALCPSLSLCLECRPASGTHGGGTLSLWCSARRLTVRSVCVAAGNAPAALASLRPLPSVLFCACPAPDGVRVCGLRLEWSGRRGWLRRPRRVAQRCRGTKARASPHASGGPGSEGGGGGGADGTGDCQHRPEASQGCSVPPSMQAARSCWDARVPLSLHGHVPAQRDTQSREGHTDQLCDSRAADVASSRLREFEPAFLCLSGGPERKPAEQSPPRP